MDALGILVEIGDLETQKEREATFSKVLHSLGGSSSVLQPEWSWTKSSEFTYFFNLKKLFLFFKI